MTFTKANEFTEWFVNLRVGGLFLYSLAVEHTHRNSSNDILCLFQKYFCKLKLKNAVKTTKQAAPFTNADIVTLRHGIFPQDTIWREKSGRGWARQVFLGPETRIFVSPWRGIC